MNSGFKERVKNSVDIVRTVGEYVRLKRIGGSGRYLGLCPFHNEKTPSFNVNQDKQFYKCFGCGKGGDVFNFVMEIEGLGFFETLKLLAERNGIPVPAERVMDDPESRHRATIQELQELAQKHFEENLFSPAGQEARDYLERRGVGKDLAASFSLGYASANGGLLRYFQNHGVPEEMFEPSGLLLKRQDGPGYYDRFRGRLMFPIANESGKTIAFGGRALGDEQPKYLNSPETAVYRKSYVLYNLHRAKEAARRGGRFVLVEGYMDVIGAWAAGVKEAVASCGTALRPEQVRAMKRHADLVVVNFDPDPAGVNAAERSVTLLLEEELRIRVASLAQGLDPDEYVREFGAEAYQQALAQSPNYFHWLAGRAREKFAMNSAEGRLEAFRYLLPSIVKLPGKLERLAVVNDLAVQLGVDAGAMLDQFRKVAVERRGGPSLPQPNGGRLLPETEKILLRLLLFHPAVVQPYVDTLLGLEQFERLESRKILEAGLNLLEADGAVDYHSLSQRLNAEDAHLLAALISTDTEGIEREQDSADAHQQMRACLAKLLRDGLESKIKALRQEVKEAERRGDMVEAMRLVQQAKELEGRLRQTPQIRIDPPA
ncbi:MAG: DNA primase [Bryobacter sp.]|nr:DNA primase [Bryobacter sp.]